MINSELPFKSGLTPYGTLRDGFHYPDKDDVIVRNFGYSGEFGEDNVLSYVEKTRSLHDELGNFDIETARYYPVIISQGEFAFVVERSGGDHQINDDDSLSESQKRSVLDLELKLFSYL